MKQADHLNLTLALAHSNLHDDFFYQDDSVLSLAVFDANTMVSGQLKKKR